MANNYSIHHVAAFLLLFSFDNLLLATNTHLSPILDYEIGNQTQTYIVHVAEPERAGFLSDEELENWHKSFLPNTTLDSGEPRLIYSYTEVMSGFAAKLTFQEVQAMQHMEGFLHATPDVQHELETTYTPQFLGLNQKNGPWNQSNNMGEGVIIGVVDSGIPRNHPSFSDAGMPTKPANWTGTCNFANFTCNNKIIGAARFQGGAKGTALPVDTGGHGSHVASIAAGNFAADALDLGGFKYKASGMAPRAHLAIYKVCPDCNRSDILKAFDEAIANRVHIINLSLGSGNRTNFHQDTVAFGAYAAVKNGIAITASAGNTGPNASSLSHSAPWLTVVGSSTNDRRLGAMVKLGNGMVLTGETVYQPSTFNSSKMLPLAYPGVNNTIQTLYCRNGSLDKINVTGKIVLCWSSSKDADKGRVVLAAGGAAMILMNQKGAGSNIPQVRHVLPASHISYSDGIKITKYYSASKLWTPNATIVFQGQTSGRRPAPAVFRGSSRGPSLVNGGILKPDVVAPGVNILAAWPYKGGPSNNYFHYDTGTSMAAPHVAGIFALIKKAHPTWSPAAIQSAVITTANDVDLDGKPIVDTRDGKEANIFARGAGQVNASRAVDPGLVYDRNFSDYVGYMCGLGYSDRLMRLITRSVVNCRTVKKIKASQLNYASIMVNLTTTSTNETVQRTVTNVGNVDGSYTAQITHPAGANVTLSSNKLQFSARKLQLSFNVTISAKAPVPKQGTISRGKLEWVSQNHVVRTPIAVVFG